MTQLILRRLLVLGPQLLLVTLGVFSLLLLIPGDAAVTLAGTGATTQDLARIRAELGLDKPYLLQYAQWLGNALHGDLGRSIYTHEYVMDGLASRLPVTLSLTAAAMILGLILGIPMGIFTGVNPGGKLDRLLSTVNGVALALPTFWVAVMLVSLLSVQFRLLPPLGYTRFSDSPLDWASHTIMPALALSLHPAAVVARQLRASLIEALSSRYIRTAWAKGGSRLVVTCKHALKNAAIPAVTVVGLQTANLLGGAVVIEKIFGIPGIGTYLFTGVNGRDISVIQGVVVVFVVANILVNLLVDITYGYLNPKVRVA